MLLPERLLPSARNVYRAEQAAGWRGRLSEEVVESAEGLHLDETTYWVAESGYFRFLVCSLSIRGKLCLLPGQNYILYRH